MECSKVCWVIVTSLILMTGGFVLTLAGWFAPPISDSVIRVRMAGPGALLAGAVLLFLSCIMCAYTQRKCCSCCYGVSMKPENGSHSLHHVVDSQASPLLMQDMREALDRCQVLDGDGGVQSTDHRGVVILESGVHQPDGMQDGGAAHAHGNQGRSKKPILKKTHLGENGVSLQRQEVKEQVYKPHPKPARSPGTNRAYQNLALPKPKGYKHVANRALTLTPPGSPMKVHVHLRPSNVTYEPVNPPPYTHVLDSTL